MCSRELQICLAAPESKYHSLTPSIGRPESTVRDGCVTAAGIAVVAPVLWSLSLLPFDRWEEMADAFEVACVSIAAGFHTTVDVGCCVVRTISVRRLVLHLTGSALQSFWGLTSITAGFISVGVGCCIVRTISVRTVCVAPDRLCPAVC
jgi:hypothetical protein